MQIGIGKSGVKIGEYGNEKNGMGTIGYIEPAAKIHNGFYGSILKEMQFFIPNEKKGEQ